MEKNTIKQRNYRPATFNMNDNSALSNLKEKLQHVELEAQKEKDLAKERYLKNKQWFLSTIQMLNEGHDPGNITKVINAANQLKQFGYRYYISNDAKDISDMGKLNFPVRFQPIPKYEKTLVAKIGVSNHILKQVMKMLSKDVQDGILIMKRTRNREIVK